MSLTKENKGTIINQYRVHDSDTGSPEVQIALLSERINYLTEHFKTHKKRSWVPARVVEDRREAPAFARLPQNV